MDLNSMLDIQICGFCGEPITSAQNFYAYKSRDHQAEVAHLSCDGLSEFVEAYGLALRLQNIIPQLGD